MGLVGFNIHTKEALIFDGGDRAFSASNLSQVGNAVVAVLENATGEKWKVTESTTGEAKAEGQALSAKGDSSGLLLLLKAIFLGEGYGSDFTKDAVLGTEKLGLPNQDLHSTITALAAGKTV
jgi:hypothetical protein